MLQILWKILETSSWVFEACCPAWSNLHPPFSYPHQTLSHSPHCTQPSWSFFFFFFFGCVGSRICARAFSSCGERGPLFIAVRGPLTIVASLVAEHRLQMCRLSSCGSRAQLFRGMWDLPRPGLEPLSPALAGGFPTTAPPGKSQAGLLILPANQALWWHRFWPYFPDTEYFFSGSLNDWLLVILHISAWKYLLKDVLHDHLDLKNPNTYTHSKTLENHITPFVFFYQKVFGFSIYLFSYFLSFSNF